MSRSTSTPKSSWSVAGSVPLASPTSAAFTSWAEPKRAAGSAERQRMRTWSTSGPASGWACEGATKSSSGLRPVSIA